MDWGNAAAWASAAIALTVASRAWVSERRARESAAEAKTQAARAAAAAEHSAAAAVRSADAHERHINIIEELANRYVPAWRLEFGGADSQINHVYRYALVNDGNSPEFDVGVSGVDGRHDIHAGDKLIFTAVDVWVGRPRS